MTERLLTLRCSARLAREFVLASFPSLSEDFFCGGDGARRLMAHGWINVHTEVGLFGWPIIPDDVPCDADFSTWPT